MSIIKNCVAREKTIFNGEELKSTIFAANIVVLKKEVEHGMQIDYTTISPMIIYNGKDREHIIIHPTYLQCADKSELYSDTAKMIEDNFAEKRDVTYYIPANRVYIKSLKSGDIFYTKIYEEKRFGIFRKLENNEYSDLETNAKIIFEDEHSGLVLELRDYMEKCD